VVRRASVEARFFFLKAVVGSLVRRKRFAPRSIEVIQQQRELRYLIPIVHNHKSSNRSG